MSFRLGVPGLSLWVDEVPPGRLLVLEGDVDDSKSAFARHVATGAASAGREGVYSRTGGGTGPDESPGWTVVEAGSLDDLPEGREDLVVDSFSYVAQDASPLQLRGWLQRTKTQARETGRCVTLTLERGMLAPATAAAVNHVADAVVQFHSRDEAEGFVQFLRIPKWVAGQVFTRNIYYTYQDRKILVDTRRRVA